MFISILSCIYKPTIAFITSNHERADISPICAAVIHCNLSRVGHFKIDMAREYDRIDKNAYH
jgi:hypothetical protein